MSSNNSDIFVTNVLTQLNVLNNDIIKKDKEIKELSSMVNFYVDTAESAMSENDICISVLIQLKSASTADEMREILNKFELDVGPIPHMN